MIWNLIHVIIKNLLDFLQSAGKSDVLILEMRIFALRLFAMICVLAAP